MPRTKRITAPVPNSAAREQTRQPEWITGKENAWLRRFRAGLSGRFEKGGESIAIEGARLVEEALRSPITVEAILVSETGRKHLSRISAFLPDSARLLSTSDKIFESIADTDTPQGVAALIRPRRAAFDDLVSGPATPLVIVLVGVQDPGNVGTILRTAEALGGSGVAACRADSLGTAHLFSPKVIRASAGAVFRFPAVEGISTPILQMQFRVAGVQMLAASTRAGATDVPAPWQLNLCGPVAVFIGNEGAGLPAEIERAADALVHIPLAHPRGNSGEGVESLNAATAAAILLYEAARQRANVRELSCEAEAKS